MFIIRYPYSHQYKRVIVIVHWSEYPDEVIVFALFTYFIHKGPSMFTNNFKKDGSQLFGRHSCLCFFFIFSTYLNSCLGRKKAKQSVKKQIVNFLLMYKVGGAKLPQF